jgi:hypothetical protein
MSEGSRCAAGWQESADNGEDEMCGRSSAFRRKMVSTIATNKTFRVIIHLALVFMKALKLQPHYNMATPNQLNFNPIFGLPGTAPPANSPPPAPSKLVIANNVDLKHFNTGISDVDSFDLHPALVQRCSCMW